MNAATPIDFGILLNIAFGVFKTGLHRHLAQAGFGDVGPSFGYVFRLLEAESLNLKAVADSLGITPQGALKLINDMVKKDYVERQEHSNDGRIKQLALTARGRAAVAHARTYHAQFEKDLAVRVGPAQAAAARAALEDIAAHYGEEGPPSLRPL